MATDVLRNLLAPVSVDCFFERYWGRQALHLRDRATTYLHLFSWSDVARVLATQRLTYPRVRVVQAGRTLPRSAIFMPWLDRRSREVGRLSATAVRGFLDAGALLVIDSIEEAVPALELLAVGLESLFDEYCQINGYFQRGEGSGFSRHYDPHDVFVLQVEGQKTWTVVDRQQRETVFGLMPGDLLYIPKGWDHSATPSASGSAHLSIGIEFATEGLPHLEGRDDRYGSPLPESLISSIVQAIPARSRPCEESLWQARRAAQWSRQHPSFGGGRGRRYDGRQLCVLAVRFQWAREILLEWLEQKDLVMEGCADLLWNVASRGPIPVADLASICGHPEGLELRLGLCEELGLVSALPLDATLPPVMRKQPETKPPAIRGKAVTT